MSHLVLSGTGPASDELGRRAQTSCGESESETKCGREEEVLIRKHKIESEKPINSSTLKRSGYVVSGRHGSCGSVSPPESDSGIFLGTCAGQYRGPFRTHLLYILCSHDRWAVP